MRLAAELKIDVYLAFSFILAARMAQDHAQPEAAVELHGAADVILERISFHVDARRPTAQRRDAGRSTRRARRQTAPRQLDTRGRVLPLDQAVAMADRVFAQVMTAHSRREGDELVGDAVEEIGLADRVAP